MAIPKNVVYLCAKYKFIFVMTTLTVFTNIL